MLQILFALLLLTPLFAEEKISTHSIQINEQTLPYTATVESGEVSYIAYVKEGENRPITFAFNGGPGSSSVWLHLGATGSRLALLLKNFGPGGGLFLSIETAASFVFCSSGKRGFRVEKSGNKQLEFNSERGILGAGRGEVKCFFATSFVFCFSGERTSEVPKSGNKKLKSKFDGGLIVIFNHKFCFETNHNIKHN